MLNQPQIKPWIVQKYGGTSIGKLLPQIIDETIPHALQSARVAVVCSARSGTTKTNGTTSLLISAIRAATASKTNTRELDRIIDALEAEHLQAACLALRNGCASTECARLLSELQAHMQRDCDGVRQVLHAAWSAGEMSVQTQDRVLATGEKLACRVVAAALKSNGIKAEVVPLDNLVLESEDDRRGGSYSPSSVVRAIRKRMLDFPDRVPVLTGFFGPLPGGLVHSVGRGYSDLCAALCAVALNASELQIWKEVDGLFTADPSKIPSARLLPTVTSEELAELTYYGSEVVHPQVVEHLREAGIPLRLKNVKKSAGTGTIVFPSSESPPLLPATPPDSAAGFSEDAISSPPVEMKTPNAVFMAMNGYHGSNQSRRTPTAVTSKDGISIIVIRATSAANPHIFLAQISEALSHRGMEVDLISSSMQSLSLAVSSKSSAAAIGLFERDLAASQLGQLGVATLRKHMSIVSVVGHRMRNMVGTAAEIFNALARAQVNICLISQGASETNISFVVKAQDALLALQVMHTNVLQIPLHSEKEAGMIKGPWLY
ncbi:hypothetical protein LTR85_010777 [Meristemomyces frigidus]|nr:hypothetical protein LTR85_010777 [Meristemomyces frigidus]